MLIIPHVSGYWYFLMLCMFFYSLFIFFFFQAEDGIRDADVTGVQTCALPIWLPDLLLPLLRGRPREPAAKRRVQKGPGVDRRRHRDDQARGVYRPGGPALAGRAGDRAAGREDGVRPAVRARARAGAAR